MLRHKILIAAFLAYCNVASVWAAEGPPASASGPAAPAAKVVLSERNFWRKLYVFFPPSLSEKAAQSAGLSTDAASRAKFMAKAHDVGLRTSPPTEGWTGVAFDDSVWLLRRGREFVCGDGRLMESMPADATSAYLRGGDPFMDQIGLVCQRGTFFMADKAKLGKLTLTVTYRGGFVAYLNGQEIARASLPAGKIEPTTAAEDYPLGAWFYADGKEKGKYLNAFDKNAPFGLRERTFGPVEIPADALRKGYNVLALEMHRSDYPAELAKVKYGDGWQRGWGTVGLSLLTLASDKADAAVSDAGPSAGLGANAWPVDITRAVSDHAVPTGDERRAPVRIVGCRNGSFSAQVVVADDRPLKDLAVKVSPLAQKDGPGIIPASAITVRYATPNPFWAGGLSYLDTVVPVDMKLDKDVGLGRRFDVLLDAPPADASVVPVWLTVAVPKDAPAALYKGKLEIDSKAGRLEMPVELLVADWTLPDVKDYVTQMNIYQSPETLAMYYKVQPWSEAHWKLIDKSMALLGRAGNIGLFIPLLAQSQRGNVESYVQWIKQADGSYQYDFTLMDKYLDVAMKHHDRERLYFVCLVAWGCEGDGDKNPVLVTVVDPKTGAKSNMPLPAYGTPEAEKLWTPLLHACRDRLKARGLEAKILVGMAWDQGPKPETAGMFARILPEAGWLTESHMRQWAYGYGTTQPNPKSKSRWDKVSFEKTAPVKYNSVVWGGGIPDPATQRLYGWQYGPGRRTMNFNRVGVDCLSLFGYPPPWSFHMWMESTMACGRNGNGNCGGDYWRVVDLLNKEGRMPSGGSGAYWNGSGTLFGIYPASNVGRTGVGNNTADLFGPGPDGPVSTVRFENALENNQEAEARIVIEKALLNKDKPLPAELAQKCQQLLDERTNILRLWQLGGSFAAPYQWQERNRRLFEAAGEVANRQ